MEAVFETGGKQYRAKAGDLVKVEKLGSEDGTKVTFDRVLLVKDANGKVTVGAPTVENAAVTAEVIESERKDKKVIIKINGKVTSSWTEVPNAPHLKSMPGRKLGSGTFALQAHDPKSVIHYRNIRVKPLK